MVKYSSPLTEHHQSSGSYSTNNYLTHVRTIVGSCVKKDTLIRFDAHGGLGKTSSTFVNIQAAMVVMVEMVEMAALEVREPKEKEDKMETIQALTVQV